MGDALYLVPEELLLALVEVAVQPLVELLPSLDGERVRDRLPRELADDVRRDVQPEDRRERPCAVVNGSARVL